MFEHGVGLIFFGEKSQQLVKFEMLKLIGWWMIFGGVFLFDKIFCLSDRFIWGCSFAQSNLSIMCWALSPKALSAHSLSSVRKSDSGFVLPSNVKLCPSSPAVACDFGSRYFTRNTNSTSARVILFDTLIFLNVSSALIHKFTWKWLIFITSFVSGCISSITGHRSSKSSIFTFLPSMCSWIPRFSIEVACGQCWVATLAIALARQLMELFASEFWFPIFCSTICNFVSCDTCVDKFWCWCDGGLRGVELRPVGNSVI